MNTYGYGVVVGKLGLCFIGCDKNEVEDHAYVMFNGEHVYKIIELNEKEYKNTLKEINEANRNFVEVMGIDINKYF